MGTGPGGRLQRIERVAQSPLVVSIVALLLLATLTALRLVGDDGGDTLAGARTTTTVHTTTTDTDDGALLADDSTTTSTSPSPATTSTTSPASTTTTSAPGTGTTSTTVCRNSGNPSCGAFRWDPAPTPDEPIVVSAATSPQSGQAQAGKPVTFTVHAADVDAEVAFCEVYDLGDGTKQGTIGTPCEVVACGERYGAWTPPERRGGTFQYVLTHTYTQPGTYTVRFFSYSGGGSTCHPYASSRTTELTFTVAAASA